MYTHSILARLFFVLCTVAAFSMVAPTLASAQEMEETQMDERLDQYWGEKRELRTIQKRMFLKDTRWAFSLYGGVVPNDDFQIFFPLGLRVDYYFSEDIGVELSGAYAFRTKTKLKKFLEDEFESDGGASAQVFLTQFIDWYASADILWSPFHGKMDIFTTKLFHFDFYVALGAGVMGLTVDPPGAAGEKSEFKIAGNVGLGAMMYVLDFLAVRVDYRHFFFEFAGGGGGLSYPAEITAGVTFFTPAPK
jgi:outer membrane beta-barrel protein